MYVVNIVYCSVHTSCIKSLFVAYSFFFTFASSHIRLKNHWPGLAVEVACKRKHSKFANILDIGYPFQAFSVETICPWCVCSGQNFNKYNWFSAHSQDNDPRLKFFLMQRKFKGEMPSTFWGPCRLQSCWRMYFISKIYGSTKFLPNYFYF